MEEKIKIYISNDMNKILLKDMELFEFYKKDHTLNKNDFLNTLIVNYYDSYQSKSNEMFENIKEILSQNIIKKQQLETAAYDLIHYIDTKTYQLESVKLDVVISLKPTKKSSQIITYIQQCLLQGSTMSNYFRNMLASYTLLPQDKREQIIFKEQYEIITEAIKNKHKIYFTTKKNENKHIASPYALTNSKEELFNYVLTEYKGKPFTFRLSRIKKIIIQKESSTFSQDNIMIFEKMLKYGPQFTILRNEEICVVLSEKGQEMYKNIYIHRPKPIRIEEDRYYFDCSRNQITQYFFRFGKHAYIESPRDLCEEMMLNYQIGYKGYSRKYNNINNNYKDKKKPV